MKKLSILLLLSLMLAACSTAAPPPETAPGPTQPAQIANPASQNCIDQGGTLQIEERGDGGQIGVCYFEDNRQCEEWALMNGACPAGGVKVTGYVTPAARYCAITGGTYAVTGESNTENEQGTCTLPDGGVCDAWDYYNGVCTSETAAPSAVSTTGWQWFVSPEVGYALQVPPDWSGQPLPDSNSGNIHGVAYTGPEGGVEVYWGVGFGGGCPSGTEPLMLATGEVQACHTTNSDGTEQWNQIDVQVEGGNDFSSRAYTSTSGSSSQSVLLQVLSTLTFRVPAAASIQPLTMEVCDGQAQAMSHTLDDLIPTQSEALLDDSAKDAWGVGCQATITGTGEQFPSPSAVAEQLAGMLQEQGWVLDPMLGADGPTGTCSSYRKDDQIAQACAGWMPDALSGLPHGPAHLRLPGHPRPAALHHHPQQRRRDRLACCLLPPAARNASSLTRTAVKVATVTCLSCSSPTPQCSS